ncbi:MAG: hypothetical protein KDD60_11285, partial [Bdellovibrionales bacterium]|nr:hypothetical protein [Bdellovibrionales bacterium]
MSARSRKKFLSKLGHFDGFDDGSVIEIASHNQHLSSVLDSLRGHGAPEQCYVISENPKLNAKEMILSDALANTIGMGFGTIIVCLAGRL